MKMTFITKIILVFVGFFLVAIVFIMKAQTELTNAENEIKKHVGQTIIIGKDTAIIIDYSILNQTYILNNGKSISESLVK